MADRLRLSPDSVALLLRGPPVARQAPAAAGPREAGRRPVMAETPLSGSEAAIERDFLVAAACHPGPAGRHAPGARPRSTSPTPATARSSLGLREAFAPSTGRDDGQAALAG